MTAGALFRDADEARDWAGRLPAPACGREHCEYRPLTDSTQNLALRAAAEGAPAGAVFLAEEQTAGRGRQGARWHSPAGRSLLLSVLLRPPRAAAGSGMLPLGTALAVCRALEGMGAVDPAVKWPNDVLLGGRKVSGILVETRGAAAVVGIGINVLQEPSDFPPGVAGCATSLLAETGVRPDRRALLALLLGEMGRILGGSTPRGWESVRGELDGRLAWRGRLVRAGNVRGRLVGLETDGRLLVDTGAGRKTAVASGSLELHDA